MSLKLISKFFTIFLLIFLKSSFSFELRNAGKNFQISSDERVKFVKWKQKFGKVYKDEREEVHAMENVLTNAREIEEHNEKYKSGQESFNRSLWIRSDLAYDEKTKILMGEIPSNITEKAKRQARLRNNFPKGPDSINWVKSGMVHSVRDQGTCGSCCFTAVGVLDGYNLKNGVSRRLSEQQLVDCSKGTNQGCNGGDVFVALRHVKINGIGALEDYTYTGRDGRCRNIPSVVKSLPLLVKERINGDENRLKDIIAAVGPVGVAIDAAPSFSNYASGIYDNRRCSKNVNHAVLAVGYGYDSVLKKEFWIIKNSWSTTWGENGYARMIRNANNQCGIANEVVYILPPSNQNNQPQQRTGNSKSRGSRQPRTSRRPNPLKFPNSK